jgi:hypothetical protein
MAIEDQAAASLSKNPAFSKQRRWTRDAPEILDQFIMAWPRSRISIQRRAARSPNISHNYGLGLYVIAICGINCLSVLVQCGFGECHTSGYELLR